MNKIAGYLLILMLMLSIDGNAYDRKKEKKNKDRVEEVVKETDYQKIMKEVKKKAVSPFLSIYQNDKNKLFLEIPLKYLNRDMLIGSTLSEISDPEYGDIGYKENDPLLVTFSKKNHSIVLEKLNSKSDLDKNDHGLKEAFEKSNINTIKEVYKIEAYNADSTAVLIDITKLILENTKDLEGLKNRETTVSYSFSYLSDRSYIDDFKSFEDNLSISTVMSYKMSLRAYGMQILSDYEISCKVTRSILLLPEDKMRSRVNDTRVSVFNTEKELLSTSNDGMKSYHVANRWRLEPVDEEAYRGGVLTEVKKPIVFYIDSSFPENWKASIKSGVERWNKAFEKIGFKNVMQAKDFPKNDPTFDPDNIKYSCVRYLPKAVANAMGPSWIDPRTGEIVNASVLLYNDIISLVNKWRFVQTAHIDERVRSKKMPQDVVEESISYAVAHEIGHCLGFMHNMAASAAYDVDSLRSVEFTQKYGTTASIMDYARYNYIAQPEDKGVKLSPPELGVWDYFTIKWNYQPIYDASTIWEEEPVLESWVDEHAGDPLYRYGRQQSVYRIDPSAIEEDLGNDPMKAGEYGIKNLKYIVKNLNNWIPDDPDYSHRFSLYKELCGQYYRYLVNVMYNVGGVYLTDVKVGTNVKPILPVDREIQKKSLAWVFNEINNVDWLDNNDIFKHLPLGLKMSETMKGKMVDLMNSKIDCVLLSAYYSTKPYDVNEYLRDIYNYSFNGLMKNQKSSDFEMKLQKLFLENSIFVYSSKLGKGPSLVIDEPILAKYEDQIREYGNTKEGEGEIDNHAGREFGKSISYLRAVKIADIDDSDNYSQLYVVKARNLIRSKINGITDSKEKAHYQSLLNKLDRVINQKN